jgi:hypothetical protein
MEANGERLNGTAAVSTEKQKPAEIDLQELAERVLRLIKREARIEQERLGQPARFKRVNSSGKRI